MFPKASYPVLSLASSLLLVAAASAAGHGQRGPVVKTGADLGLASGVWITPSNDADGSLRGELRNELDEVVFLFDARLHEERSSPALKRGTLQGHLRPMQKSLVPQKKPIQIVVTGRWTEEAQARGEFDALAMADLGSPFLPKIVIAVLHGRFSLAHHAAVAQVGPSVRGARGRQLGDYLPRSLFDVSAQAGGDRSLADFGTRTRDRVIVCPRSPDYDIDGQQIGSRSARKLALESKRVAADKAGERKLADYATRSVGDVIVCPRSPDYDIDADQIAGRTARGPVLRDDEAKACTFLARWSLSD